MASLAEKYRPTELTDVVGQDDVIALLVRLWNCGGWGGRAFYLTGPTGVGKTTVGRIIARAVAGTELGHVRELDAGDLTEARVATIARSTSARTLFGGWAIIVNEAHGLDPTVVRRLLTAMEPISPWTVWIFTSTSTGTQLLLDKSEDAKPLMDRCKRLKLYGGTRPETGAAFAQRAREIALKEGLDGAELSTYHNKVRGDSCKGSMRALLEAVESGEIGKGK